jgi:drug/metabolite transporter (DMT)-like permease
MFILGTVLHLWTVNWVHGTVFGNLGRSAPGEPNVDIMWSLTLAYVLQAILLAYIYPKGYSGGKPLTEGLRFGFVMGVLIFITYAFFLYGKFKVEFTPTLLHGFMHVVETMGGGITIALIYGKKE